MEEKKRASIYETIEHALSQKNGSQAISVCGEGGSQLHMWCVNNYAYCEIEPLA